MDGQAENAPDTLADLASMLDTPETESEEHEEAEQDAEESTAEGDTDESADAETDEPDDSQEEDGEPAPERKHKVSIKADDGTETVEEVPESELVKGYQRQADYTRKTQALAKRESEAVQFLTTKHNEIRQQYLQQAEVQRAAIVGMAGLKNEAEMAALAQSDPAAWVAESQRQQSIRGYLSQLEQQIQGEKQQQEAQAKHMQDAQRQQMYQAAWGELSKEGIDKPKLAKIYEDVSKLYGFTSDELGNVYDHRLVRALRDAAAYRELKAQRKAVTEKVSQAPKMPQRQHTTPAQTKQQEAVEQRFRKGTAKLNDLAALLR